MKMQLEQQGESNAQCISSVNWRIDTSQTFCYDIANLNVWRSAMTTRKLLAKKNSDGSFSVSYAAGDLIEDAFVDFYSEKEGSGFQREETARKTRGRAISSYIKRCVQGGNQPNLFELTANARVGSPQNPDENWSYDYLDDDGILGFLTLIPVTSGKWLSVTDGGTRLLGIEIALAEGIITRQHRVDVRIFIKLSRAREIAKFLLINDNQKKVRTDLGLRVVQRAVDEGSLKPEELEVLATVVPDKDSWRFEASRIAGRMNSDPDSPWKDRVQMPSTPSNCTTLQSFFTSLRPILTEADIQVPLNQMMEKGEMQGDKTEFIIKILKNFWSAVQKVNPTADDEPQTNVLWAPIGSSASHIALAAVLKTILNLDGNNLNLTKDRFIEMIEDSKITEYEFWYSRPGSKKPADFYPAEKGDATMLTGAANYKKLGLELETEWRAQLHAKPDNRVIAI